MVGKPANSRRFRPKCSRDRRRGRPPAPEGQREGSLYDLARSSFDVIQTGERRFMAASACARA